jgi:hypothetical protein
VLTGERQKDHIYYSCHTVDCPTTGIREDRANQRFIDEFRYATLPQGIARSVEDEIRRMTSSKTVELEEVRKSHELGLGQLRARLDRLVDAYVDRMIDKEAFEARRSALLFEEVEHRERIAALSERPYGSPDHALEIFELSKSLYSRYISASREEKRDLVETTTSNRLVERKALAFALKSPFRQVAEAAKCSDGDPNRHDVRTLAQEIIKVAEKAEFPPLPTETKINPGWATVEEINERRTAERIKREFGLRENTEG